MEAQLAKQTAISWEPPVAAGWVSERISLLLYWFRTKQNAAKAVKVNVWAMAPNKVRLVAVPGDEDDAEVAEFFKGVVVPFLKGL